MLSNPITNKKNIDQKQIFLNTWIKAYSHVIIARQALSKQFWTCMPTYDCPFKGEVSHFKPIKK